MRRRRIVWWALRIGVALCALLMIGSIFMWVRSYRRVEGVYFRQNHRTSEGLDRHHFGFVSDGGGVLIVDDRTPAIGTSVRSAIAEEEWLEPFESFSRPLNPVNAHVLEAMKIHPLVPTWVREVHPLPGWSGADPHHIFVVVPYWLCILIFSLPPFAWFLTRRRRRHIPGHCRRCGYDLRATPRRCPECGLEIEAS